MTDNLSKHKRYGICKKLLLLLSLALVNQAALADTVVTDEHIRSIVASLLQEKDQQIKKLEARIQQLEQSAPPTALASVPIIPAKNDTPVKPIALNANNTSTAKPDSATLLEPPKDKKTATILDKLVNLSTEVEELKETAQENGLKLNGFFDVNAKTDNSSNQTFSVGSIELDLEYDYSDNFAASTALVLCGNSSGIDAASFPSAPVAVSCGSSGPGGIGAGPAGFAVAFIDYHRFDHSLPPRGRIFNNQGFHIQAGRFDLPFSTDYQNYANKDRVTITAPITTSRMQFGGYNGDGMRSYGSWKLFNYSVFWTDAMYANDGTSLGGRLGVTLGDNTYRSHNANPEGIELGISHLSDLDYDNNTRNLVYGADLSFGYSIFRLQSELMWLQAQNHFIVDDGISPAVDYGHPNELGYHTTLITDLKTIVKQPIFAFIRYGRWQPQHKVSTDFDGSLVAVNNVSLLTVGFNYTMNEYMKIKFEYTDSLGTSTQEHYFDRKLGIAQMVVAF
ncbi:MAG: hypothetical protein Q7U57_17235 [Methylovulum sp.]|nr:hypothetical protein [Methylovulum sp.]